MKRVKAAKGGVKGANVNKKSMTSLTHLGSRVEAVLPPGVLLPGGAGGGGRPRGRAVVAVEDHVDLRQQQLPVALGRVGVLVDGEEPAPEGGRAVEPLGGGGAAPGPVAEAVLAQPGRLRAARGVLAPDAHLHVGEPAVPVYA